MNFSKSKKQVLGIVVILLISVFGASAQESRFVNSFYKVAFQPPEGSTRSSSSTSDNVTYNGNPSQYGLVASLNFSSSSNSEIFSKLSASDAGADLLGDLLTSALKSKGTDMLILEKQSIKINGINSFRMISSTTLSGIKVRILMFAIPVKEHNRMYTFIIMAMESYADKWFPVAEKAVKSFAILDSENEMQSAISQGTNCKAEIIFWETIRDSKNSGDFKAYIEKYPKGEFITLAKIRLEALSPKPVIKSPKQ